MKVVFLSNYFNHHQRPISSEFFRAIGDEYTFIETEPMEKERVNLGWSVDSYPSYVVDNEKYNSNKEAYTRFIDEADVVIIGSAPNSLIKKRIAEGKLVLRYSERPFKKKLSTFKRFLAYRKVYKKNPKFANMYLLCASAYAQQDYKRLGLYENKAYKWGYFPETIEYGDIDALIDAKIPNSIVWVARFIDWKHPEVAIEIAKKLRQDGYSFELNMIGNGEMLEEIKSLVAKEELSGFVNVLGAMKPEEVRQYMEKSEIHIFTSDRQEGWGAVLNESMNSACAVVANREIGAAPYLIDNDENGFVYDSLQELYEITKKLLDDKAKRRKVMKKAYQSIINEWNAGVATERLLKIVKGLIDGNNIVEYKTGPLSRG